MSRMFRSAAFALALAATPAAFAQERGDQSPFDLARALRDGDQPDLALEYLDELAKTAAPNWQMVPNGGSKTPFLFNAPNMAVRLVNPGVVDIWETSSSSC